MQQQPPRFVRQILKWFCHVDFIEETEGDLEEQFHENLSRHGLLHARLAYMSDVFSVITGRSVNREAVPFNRKFFSVDRLRHFGKLAFRNMLRSRSSTIINLTGLAVSLATCLLISLYLVDESSYDAFHPNADNVYRISFSYNRFGDGAEETDARAAGMWSVSLKEDFPEVKRFTRFSRFGMPGYVRLESQDKIFVEPQFFWVDSTYTDIFSLPMIAGGEPSKILRDPHQVIVNETMAKKYFGDEDPLGKTLTYSRAGMDFSLTVTGVMKNYPSNAHFHPDFIASNQALDLLWKRDGSDRVNSWTDSFTYSFLELAKGTDLGRIRDALKKIMVEHYGDNAKTMQPRLVKLTDLHFNTGMLIELEAPGNKSYLYIFASIGVLILLVACINYMNLATARSVRRAKEVGLCKTLGVHRGQLMLQFMGESIILSAVALLLAGVLVVFFLPYFDSMTAKTFTVTSFLESGIFWKWIALVFVVGIVSGSYPALYLSRFRPVEALSGKLQRGAGPENFRKVLVIFQFSITILLLIGTFVVNRQMSYIRNTKLGEHQDQVLTVRMLGVADASRIESFKYLARQRAEVHALALGNHIPKQESTNWIDHEFQVPDVGRDVYRWDMFTVDFDFPALFNLEFIAGRNFIAGNPADTSAVLLNESAVTALGRTPESAVGLIMENARTPDDNGGFIRRYTVIGVVKDFSYRSVRRKVSPLVIYGRPINAEVLHIKMSSTDLPATVDYLQRMWKQVYPATPFEYWFMNEEFNRLYEMEIRMDQVFRYLSFLGIFIACLGLFGLASYTVEQRTREIGIRKVLGATSATILVLLTSRFVKLVVVAFAISAPVSFFLANRWLSGFAYRAVLDVTLFVWIAAGVLLLTCLTVGAETWRAARSNPADAIRHE